MPLQCLNCGLSSPDDKRFCADCGAPLDENLGAIKRYLDAYLRREIQTLLKEEFRDQKLVELETTEAIAEKLTSWAKLFASFVGVPIAVAVVLLGFFGVKSYSDFSKLIQEKQQDISSMLSKAQSQAADLKQKGDEMTKNFEHLKTQFAENERLGDQLNTLTGKVNSIEQQMIKISPSANKTPVLEGVLQKLLSFHDHLGEVGFRLQNLKQMTIATRDSFPSRAVAEFDEQANEMQLRVDHVGDVTLALSSYAGHIVGQQQNLKEVSYEWVPGTPYYAAKFGLEAYLTCSFLDKPNFTFRGVNLSGQKPRLSAIRYAEDGYELWGGLFWEIRDLLEMAQADRLIVSAWLTVQPPPNARDFPTTLAKILLDTYKSKSDGKYSDRLHAILQSHGFDM